jgi:hypothetical protein
MGNAEGDKFKAQAKSDRENAKKFEDNGEREKAEAGYAEAGKHYCQAGTEYSGAGSHQLAYLAFDYSADCWGDKARLTSDDGTPNEREIALQHQISALIAVSDEYAALGETDKQVATLKKANGIWGDYRKNHPNSKIDLTKHPC